MPGSKFTDRKLAELYLSLCKHYNDCVSRTSPKMTDGEIYSELLAGVYQSLNGNDSIFSGMDPLEYEKVYKVLNTFFQAYKPNTPVQIFQPSKANQGIPTRQVHVTQTYTHYCRNNDFLFTWILLDSLNRPYHCGGGGNLHRHHDNGGSSLFEGSDGKDILIILGIILALIALVIMYYCLKYLAIEFLNSMERFVYNEGVMQASISILSMIAFGAVAGFIVFALLSNPVGLILAGVVCIGFASAAIGSFITNAIQEVMITTANEDALDPSDPHRFTVTSDDEIRLIEKNIDPIKVKCAIVALRAEIGTEKFPSYSDRLFSDKDTSIATKNLKLVRQLRRGDLQEIDVGGLHFDLRENEVTNECQFTN